MPEFRPAKLFTLLSLLLTGAGCGAGATGAPGATAPTATAASVTSEAGPLPILELVGADASFVAELELSRLRDSEHHETALTLFERALPADYPARDAARAFAERTERGVLALVDRGERRGSFLYLLRGSYASGDLDALIVDEDPLSETQHREHTIRHKGEVGAALLGDHTWLFGSITLVREALDRHDGVLPREGLRPELVDMLGLLDVAGATAGFAMVPTDSIHSLIGENDPDNAELASHLISLGARVEVTERLELTARVRADSPESAAAAESWLARQVIALRADPALIVLGLAPALAEAELHQDERDLVFQVEAEVPAALSAGE